MGGYTARFERPGGGTVCRQQTPAGGPLRKEKQPPVFVVSGLARIDGSWQSTDGGWRLTYRGWNLTDSSWCFSRRRLVGHNEQGEGAGSLAKKTLKGPLEHHSNPWQHSHFLHFRRDDPPQYGTYSTVSHDRDLLHTCFLMLGPAVDPAACLSDIGLRQARAVIAAVCQPATTFHNPPQPSTTIHNHHDPHQGGP